MKKPIEPFAPNEWEYEEKYDPKVIKSFLYVHPDCTDSFKDRYEDGEEETTPDFEEWWYDTEVMSLQDLFDITPVGADPKKIIISIHRDRDITDIVVRVTNNTPTDNTALAKRLYKKEYKKYLKEKEKYLEDSKKYEEWEKQEEIKNL